MLNLEEMLQEALAAVSEAESLAALDRVRVHYLGKKGTVTQALSQLKSLPADQRPGFGQAVNQLKVAIADAIGVCHETLETERLNKVLESEALDISLPGRGQQSGSLHPVTLVRERIEAIFAQWGFLSIEGPELETDFYAYTALNFPPDHPARDMQDTFFLEADRILRPHTSPVQIRYMETHEPPLRIIAPGRVYRRDSDLTHTPMFHQIEGLLVDEGVSFADLKGILHAFLSQFFEEELTLRFRPSFFPFTEPSAEVDFRCINCGGGGCRICSHTGWLEVLGCGMVHPNVLRNVNIDPEKYTGWAFGLGIDRFAMLRYNIPDLRLLFEDDIRLLEQFC